MPYWEKEVSNEMIRKESDVTKERKEKSERQEWRTNLTDGGGREMEQILK